MEDFVEKRLEICKACPISTYDQTFGLKCDSRKGLSPDGKESSLYYKEGWIKGCGCILKYKCARENNHCVARKG